MPRRVTSRIHDYFIYDVNRSICQLLNKSGYICNAAIKGRHAGNLEKHVKTWHADEWANYWNDKTQMLVPSDSETSSLLNTTPHFINVDLSMIQSQVIEYESEETEPPPPPPQPQPEKKRKLEHSPPTPPEKANNKPSHSVNEIEDAIIEMVTVNGFPFNIVEESGFKKLAALAYKASSEPIAPGKAAISRQKIQKLVKSKAESIQATIVNLLKNKLICLRIDCAAVDKRHVYSIGVHIRKSYKSLAFHLAVIDLANDHTQDILKEEILNVLLEYEVYINQIYHIVVTNCSQALKAANKIEDTDDSRAQQSANTSLAGPSSSSASKEYLDFNEYDSDFDIFEVEETEYDPDQEEGSEIGGEGEISSDEATEKLVEEVIACWSVEKHIITSRNLTHVFQLTVLDTFEEEVEINALLKKIRSIVKKLRTPTYLRQLKSYRCKKKPILDSKSRLLSSYDMLQRFVELKPYLDQISVTVPDIAIPLTEWNLVMNIVDSLKPLKMAVLRLNSKDVPISEFYKVWITSFLKTKKIGTEFSLHLCKNMDKRKSWLFNNVTFKACLFLDPRFKNTLNRSDHEEVLAHLVQTYERMTTLQPLNSADDVTEVIGLPLSVKMEQSANDDDDDLFQYVKSMVKTPVKQRKRPINIHAALKTFKDSAPLLEIEDVPAFWQEKKHLYKEVYKLSQIILSVPPNNACLDVFISQLKFISNVSSNSVESRLLKDLVLVRSNFESLNKD